METPLLPTMEVHLLLLTTRTPTLFLLLPPTLRLPIQIAILPILHITQLLPHLPTAATLPIPIPIPRHLLHLLPTTTQIAILPLLPTLTLQIPTHTLPIPILLLPTTMAIPLRPVITHPTLHRLRTILLGIPTPVLLLLCLPTLPTILQVMSITLPLLPTPRHTHPPATAIHLLAIATHPPMMPTHPPVTATHLPAMATHIPQTHP